MKKYPSRIKYEKSHPTVSFRLDRELKERLEKVLEGKSFADFVKEGLGVREREKASLEKERAEAYREGVKDGYRDGEEDFGVYARCSICGRYMTIDAPELREELGRYIEKERIVHIECKDEEERRRR